MQVSIFKDAFTVSPLNVEFNDILFHIKNGKWKDKIAELRSLPEETYKKRKTELPGVTFGGTFSKRSNKEITSYSSLLLIDIDNLSDEQTAEYKSVLSQDHLILCVFVSPSGKGLKLIFITDNTDHNKHVSYFKAAQKHLEETYAITVDKSGKDVARLCFVSYDPELYYNGEAKRLECPSEIEAFPRESYVSGRRLVNTSKKVEPIKALEVCVAWVERQGKHYTEGQRNVFLHSVSCAMNRVGIDMDECFSVLSDSFDLEEEEIHHVVKMAYLHNRHEFGVYPLNPDTFPKAPDYSDITDGQSAVMADIISVIAGIHDGNQDMNFIGRVAGRYIDDLIAKQFLDISEEDKGNLVKETIEKIREKKTEHLTDKSLPFEGFDKIAEMYADAASRSSDMRMHIDVLDDMNILVPDLFIGMIGLPQTYKSILASHIARENAKAGVPVIYLSGEMSRGQTFERNSTAEMGINWKLPPYNERKFDKDFVIGVGENLQAIFKGNLFNIHMKDFTRESICATVAKIELSIGKKVKLIIIDGVSEFDWKGKDEISAAIMNCMEAKEIAKDTHTCVIGLMHTSGRPDKHYRNTADFARGGNKTIGQMDAMLMTSLIVHPDTNMMSNEDVIYYSDKFYLRYQDKRGANGIVNSILSVDHKMNIRFLDKHTASYEIKIEKK